MRLSRIDAERLDSCAPLAALASAGQLDLLQLDYDVDESPAHSARFLEHFRTLHKHLYLEPDLRLITNAGGGAVVPCIEALGNYLREHADNRMPISAVRGANILPCLEGLAAEGVELIDGATGQPLRTCKEPLIAAQVELGAGPFAAAWDEGSRIVVAGGYDLAAPFIGASASEHQLDWGDYDALARLAVAARATEFAAAIAELDESGSVTLESSAAGPLDAHPLVKQLQGVADEQLRLRFADVECDVRNLELRRMAIGSLSVEETTGHKPVKTWRVRLTYSAGNVVDSHQQTIVRWSRVPRDAVRVSVDTRPASEWY